MKKINKLNRQLLGTDNDLQEEIQKYKNEIKGWKKRIPKS